MAQAATSKFGEFLVTIGNGATPTEVFASPCGFTEKSFSLSAQTQSTDVPDCDNPDAATWPETEVRSRSATITGSGVLAKQSAKTWTEKFLLDTAFNAKVIIPGALADGGGTWNGPWRLTSFEITGTIGEKNKVSVNMESAGKLTWVPAA
jgi:predicted secreted protein